MKIFVFLDENLSLNNNNKFIRSVYGLRMNPVFSADKQWVAYETLQADVFDYVMATVPSYGLKVFQSPMGEDIRKMKKEE